MRSKESFITGFGWLKLSSSRAFFNNDVLVRWDSTFLYRMRKPSKKYSELFGHTPLSLEEFIQYSGFVRGSETLVIGTGFDGKMIVMKEVVNYLDKSKLSYFVERTPKAIALYNSLLLRNVKVVGLFHLTC